MANYAVKTAPKLPPPHPGGMLRDALDSMKHVTLTSASADLGISRSMLHRIMRKEAPITPEMALRIGKFMGNGPELWLAMQQRHDLWKAREAMADEVDQIPNRAIQEAA